MGGGGDNEGKLGGTGGGVFLSCSKNADKKNRQNGQGSGGEWSDSGQGRIRGVEGGGGVRNPKVCVQKRAQINSFVNFVFSRDESEKGVQGRVPTPLILWLSAVLIHP